MASSLNNNLTAKSAASDNTLMRYIASAGGDGKGDTNGVFSQYLGQAIAQSTDPAIAANMAKTVPVSSAGMPETKPGTQPVIPDNAQPDNMQNNTKNTVPPDNALNNADILQQAPIMPEASTSQVISGPQDLISGIQFSGSQFLGSQLSGSQLPLTPGLSLHGNIQANVLTAISQQAQLQQAPLQDTTGAQPSASTLLQNDVSFGTPDISNLTLNHHEKTQTEKASDQPAESSQDSSIILMAQMLPVLTPQIQAPPIESHQNEVQQKDVGQTQPDASLSAAVSTLQPGLSPGVSSPAQNTTLSGSALPTIPSISPAMPPTIGSVMGNSQAASTSALSLPASAQAASFSAQSGNTPANNINTMNLGGPTIPVLTVQAAMANMSNPSAVAPNDQQNAAPPEQSPGLQNDASNGLSGNVLSNIQPSLIQPSFIQPSLANAQPAVLPAAAFPANILAGKQTTHANALQEAQSVSATGAQMNPAPSAQGGSDVSGNPAIMPGAMQGGNNTSLPVSPQVQIVSQTVSTGTGVPPALIPGMPGKISSQMHADSVNIAGASGAVLPQAGQTNAAVTASPVKAGQESSDNGDSTGSQDALSEPAFVKTKNNSSLGAAKENAVQGGNAADISGGVLPLMAHGTENAKGVENNTSVSQSTLNQVVQGISKEINPADGTQPAGKSITLQLKPEALGEVRINLTSNADHQVSARLITSTPEVRDILSGQMDVLKASLEKQGVQVDRITIVVAGGAGTETQQHSGRGGQDGANHPQQEFNNAYQAFSSSQQQNYAQTNAQQQYRPAFNGAQTAGGLAQESSSDGEIGKNAMPQQESVNGRNEQGNINLWI